MSFNRRLEQSDLHFKRSLLLDGAANPSLPLPQGFREPMGRVGGSSQNRGAHCGSSPGRRGPIRCLCDTGSQSSLRPAGSPAVPEGRNRPALRCCSHACGPFRPSAGLRGCGWSCSAFSTCSWALFLLLVSSSSQTSVLCTLCIPLPTRTRRLRRRRRAGGLAQGSPRWEGCGRASPLPRPARGAGGAALSSRGAGKGAPPGQPSVPPRGVTANAGLSSRARPWGTGGRGRGGRGAGGEREG